MIEIETTPDLVRNAYRKVEENLAIVRERLGGRPMTYAEKVLLGHLNDPKGQNLEPGKSYLELRPDRVAMQDATAQMAILQFISSGRDETAVPTTVHCDHLIQAYQGVTLGHGDRDRTTNGEVYDFLRSASAKYGIGFWGPGAGIIHQVVLEKYAFPGGMMIGTDSHTPNAGGLGMFACGVGGADAVDVMADFPWEVLYPNLVGVKLVGQLSGWTSPKDVILKVCEILTVKGGTNRVDRVLRRRHEVAFVHRQGHDHEHGRRARRHDVDLPLRRVAWALYAERAPSAKSSPDIANEHAELLKADPEVEADPEKFYDVLVEIDLSTLEPHIVGPHTPDLARPVSEDGDRTRRSRATRRI